MEQRRVVPGRARAGRPVSQAVVAGGFVYTSATLDPAVNGGGSGTPPDDVGLQTRHVLEELARTLQAAGSSLEQAVSVAVGLRRTSDFGAMNEAYREYFRERPPVRTTIGADLPSGALVQMSAIAVPAGAARETLHPAGWIASPRPYSYIVRAGGLVFLSGLVSRRGSDDTAVQGPVDVQVRTILDNAGVLLTTAGVGYGAVVSARVFLTDDSAFEAMNSEYRRYFASEPPARATVVSPLMGNDALVEISLVASTEGKQQVGPVVSPTLPLSSAVRAGRHVFLSGILGNTDANAGDVAAQTREALTRIGRTLQAAGVSPSDVVDSTVYLPDLSQAGSVDAVVAGFFPLPPARTTIGAGLVSRSGLIEIMLTAVR